MRGDGGGAEAWARRALSHLPLELDASDVVRPCEPAVLEGAPRPEQELLLPQDEVRLPHPVPAHLAVGRAEELRQPAALRLERLKDQERLLGVGVRLEAEAAEVEPLLPHAKRRSYW